MALRPSPSIRSSDLPASAGVSAPGRLVRAAPLLLSAVVAAAGTALPWLTETASLPPRAGHPVEETYHYLGLEYGNGWFVILAAVLLALVAVMALVRGLAWIDWLVLLPAVIGGLSLGHWLAALNRGGSEFPLGFAVSLIGILLATPAIALLHRGRLAGRLVIAGATLVATAIPFLLGGLLYTFAPILIYRVY